MRIRTRVAGVVAGTAFAGLTALAIGAAAPAGAQQLQPANQTVSVASQHAAIGQSCWNGDCGGWDDDDWGWGGGWDDDWDGGW